MMMINAIGNSANTDTYTHTKEMSVTISSQAELTSGIFKPGGPRERIESIDRLKELMKENEMKSASSTFVWQKIDISGKSLSKEVAEFFAKKIVTLFAPTPTPATTQVMLDVDISDTCFQGYNSGKKQSEIIAETNYVLDFIM